MSLDSDSFILTIVCRGAPLTPLLTTKMESSVKRGEGKGDLRWECVPVLSLRLNHLSLYPHSIKVNFIIKFPLISHCQWRCLIAERKMTPILSESSADVTMFPITALQPPYLPSPQTPSRAFFLRTSKHSKVIKIAPA